MLGVSGHRSSIIPDPYSRIGPGSLFERRDELGFASADVDGLQPVGNREIHSGSESRRKRPRSRDELHTSASGEDDDTEGLGGRESDLGRMDDDGSQSRRLDSVRERPRGQSLPSQRFVDVEEESFAAMSASSIASSGRTRLRVRNSSGDPITSHRLPGRSDAADLAHALDLSENSSGDRSSDLELLVTARPTATATVKGSVAHRTSATSSSSSSSAKRRATTMSDDSTGMVGDDWIPRAGKGGPVARPAVIGPGAASGDLWGDEIDTIRLHENDLRKGKWPKEEEDYVDALKAAFEDGMLPLRDGSTLRATLAIQLHCAPMRITKKFAGDTSLGKKLYRRQYEGLTPLEWKSASDAVLARIEPLWVGFSNRLNQTAGSVRLQGAVSFGIGSPEYMASIVPVQHYHQGGHGRGGNSGTGAVGAAAASSKRRRARAAARANSGSAIPSTKDRSLPDLDMDDSHDTSDSGLGHESLMHEGGGSGFHAQQGVQRLLDRSSHHLAERSDGSMPRSYGGSQLGVTSLPLAPSRITLAPLTSPRTAAAGEGLAMLATSTVPSSSQLQAHRDEALDPTSERLMISAHPSRSAGAPAWAVAKAALTAVSSPIYGDEELGPRPNSNDASQSVTDPAARAPGGAPTNLSMSGVQSIGPAIGSSQSIPAEREFASWMADSAVGSSRHNVEPRVGISMVPFSAVAVPPSGPAAGVYPLRAVGYAAGPLNVPPQQPPMDDQQRTSLQHPPSSLGPSSGIFVPGSSSPVETTVPHQGLLSITAPDALSASSLAGLALSSAASEGTGGSQAAFLSMASPVLLPGHALEPHIRRGSDASQESGSLSRWFRSTSDAPEQP